jgi:WD40 repeat protein
MVVATTAGTLELWDVPNRKQLAVLDVDLPKVAGDTNWTLKSLALSPRRLFLAAGTDTGIGYVWNFKERSKSGPLVVPPSLPGDEEVAASTALYLCFSCDDKHMALLREDRVEIWDPVRRTMIKSVDLPEQGRPRRLAYSPDDSQILVTYDSGSIVLVDADGGDVLETIRIPRGTVVNLSFTADEVPMASLGRGSTVQVWDLLRLGRVRTLGPYPTRLLDVTIAPYGDTCLTLAAGGHIDRWDLCTGRHLGRQTLPERTLRELHKAPEIDRVLTCGPREGLVALEGIAFNGAYPLRRVDLPIPKPGIGERVVTYNISSDKRLVAMGYTSGQVRIFSYHQPSEPMVLEGTGRSVTTLTFAPNDQLLAVADEGGCVRLWDVMSGQVHWEEHSVRMPVYMMTFTPSGRLLSIPRGNNIEIWNLESRRRVARLTGHDGPIRTVVHGLGGRLILSASDDGTARLWDVAQQRTLRVLDDHPGPVTAATLDSNLHFLLTTSGPYLSVWRLADATLLARFAYCGAEQEENEEQERHHWIAYTHRGNYTGSVLEPPNVSMTRPGTRVRLSEEDRLNLFDPRAVSMLLLR